MPTHSRDKNALIFELENEPIQYSILKLADLVAEAEAIICRPNQLEKKQCGMHT